MPEVIYVRALCKAATVLGLTNQEVADRLGVKPEIFDDAVTREENGGHPSVSSKHPNIYAAATALLEEASQIENGGQDDVFAVVGDGGAPRRPESETRETPEKAAPSAPVMPALTQVLTVPIMLVIQIMTIPVPCPTNSSRRPWRFQGRTKKRKDTLGRSSPRPVVQIWTP